MDLIAVNMTLVTRTIFCFVELGFAGGRSEVSRSEVSRQSAVLLVFIKLKIWTLNRTPVGWDVPVVLLSVSVWKDVLIEDTRQAVLPQQKSLHLLHMTTTMQKLAHGCLDLFPLAHFFSK
ncbi:unnamed protein product [Pleuronectes platessa]|uniref:Uncharacterized protein n=1 Tax=Pleuronectes platessa TaxID=8262 RepID=A0A9N7YLL2_PLEPL|nr:unnamed protein product [Pleuronectes platessa]